MNNRKYIGMDVHQASISIAVSDAAGKVLMESIIETKAATILECIQGIRGRAVQISAAESPERTPLQADGTVQISRRQSPVARYSAAKPDP